MHVRVSSSTSCDLNSSPSAPRISVNRSTSVVIGKGSMRCVFLSNWSLTPSAPIEIVVQHLVEISLRRRHGDALRTEQLLGGLVVEYLFGGEVVEKDRRGLDRAANFFRRQHAERHEHGAEQGARNDRGPRDRD